MVDFTEARSWWQALGAIGPEELWGTRVQLHWAAQLASMPSGVMAAPQDDDSHRALTWASGFGGLLGGPIKKGKTFRVGLRFEDQALVLMDEETISQMETPLEGMTFDGAIEWLTEAIRDYTGKKPPNFPKPEYEIPDHPVGHGEPFEVGSREERQELARWYSNTQRFCQALTSQIEGASEVQCWPHRFDIATLITVVPGNENTRKTVGVGMTPGDRSYEEPYIYVAPWPYPSDKPAFDLDGPGHWHTEDWYGAVLTGSALLEGTEQGKTVNDFITMALMHAQKMISI